MRKMQARVDDLHYDVLKEILIRVAKSSGGAKDFAKTISVCKAFRQFVEDGDVLRAVVFDDLLVSGRWQFFQLVEGLINRCAKAGHAEAHFILAKIILVSTSRLVDLKLENIMLGNDNLIKEEAKLASFVENFLADRNNLDTHASGLHFNLVRLFLSRARFGELQEMQPYIDKYIEYFIGCRSLKPEPFLVKFQYLCTVDMKLEIFKNMLVEEIKKLRLDAYKSIPIVTLTEERLCEMDVAGDLAKSHGWTSTIDLLEKIDVSIKRFKSLKAVVKEEIYKAVQLSLGNTQFVVQCFSLLQVYYHAEVSIEQCAMDLLNLVAYFENQREDLISKFDVLFFVNVNV